MQIVGEAFKSESMRNYNRPVVAVGLYDDSWDYNSGTAWGTKIGKYCYNDAGEKQYMETGTCSQHASWVVSGTHMGQNVHDYTGTVHADEGTWTSPILTPYYNATWDTLLVRDHTNEGMDNTNLLFYENFESYEQFLKNEWMPYWGASSVGPGTITTNGIDGCSWTPIPSGNYVQNNILSNNNNNLYLSGEIQFQFSLSTPINGNIIFSMRFKDSSLISISQNATGTGTYIKMAMARTGGAGTTYSNMGTISTGTGIIHNINLSWVKSGTMMPWLLWLDGNLNRGTFYGTMGTSINYFYMCGNTNDRIDNLYIYGTAIHDATWTGNFLKSNRTVNYYVRTSADGTAWSAYENIKSTASYDLTNEYNLYKVNKTSKFAQFRAVMAGEVGTHRAWISQIKPHCYCKLNEMYIKNISAITTQSENAYKIGQLDTQEVTVELSNAPSNYFNKQQIYAARNSVDWNNNVLGFNRPFQMNSPIKIYAGYEAAAGTELVSVFTGYIYKLDLDAENRAVSLNAYDTWGLIGDKTAGTRSTTGTVSDYVREIMLYNGIPAEKLYIDDVSAAFSNVQCVNGKPSPLLSSNGGFGDIWGEISTDNGFNKHIRNVSQTTDGKYTLMFGDGFFSTFNTSLGKISDSSLNYEKYLYKTAGAVRYNNGTFTVWIFGIKPVGFNNPIYGTAVGTMGVKFKFNQLSSGFSNAYGFSYIGTIPAADYAHTTDTPFSVFWNAAEGTGYYFNSENLHDTVMYKFDENMIFAAGSTDMGTSDGKWCIYPRAYDMAQGTMIYDFLLHTSENGTRYIKKYAGTSPYAYIEKATIPKAEMGTFTWNEYLNNLTFNIGYTINNNIPTVRGFNNDGNKVWNIGFTGVGLQHSALTTGSIYINGTVSSNGTAYLNKTNGQFFFNKFYSTTDIFTASYSTLSIPVSAYLGSVTVSDAIKDLNNLAIAYSWFDTNGNFHFQSKSKIENVGIITNSSDRAYTDELVETVINSTITEDISKIKNEITISGTGTNTNVKFLMAESIDIYGTRTMGAYTNTLISTMADLNSYGTIILNYLSQPKDSISLKTPGHPELEVSDAITFIDGLNNITIPNAFITRHAFDPMNWTSEIDAESIKKT